MLEILQSQTRHLPDIDFTIVADVKEYTMDVKVFEIASREPMLWQRESEHHPDTTADMAEAGVFLHGHIKWDGCSNWHFDTQDSCMLHFCCVEHGQAIGKLFEAIYAMGEELIPRWLHA